jgi:histidyl-tRNA synthetase
VDDVVLVLDEELRPAACGLASQLRAAGRIVDIQLEPRKKMKAAIRAAERAGAARLLIVGGDEWARGAVAVKDLHAFEQSEVAVADLVAAAEAGAGAPKAAAAAE